MSQSVQLRVQLEPSYPILIGRGLLSGVQVPHARVAVLADAAVAGRLTLLKASLERGGSKVDLLELPAGEGCKSLAVFAGVLSRLAQMGLTRDAAVIGVGGGATSDLAGFVAASYLRGIAFYTVPTTLLAMVDASVGGKTGVNLPEGKNLVGAFHQPSGVWADLETLSTLPAAVFREGVAEAFKHGLIADPSLCAVILEPDFGLDSPRLQGLVAAAVEVKAKIVAKDPFERAERAFLNYGHTLAHALEAVTDHRMAHGEAVAYGMHYAACLGRLLGLVDVTEQTKAFLAYQRPQALPKLDFSQLEPFMARDKKSDAQGVRFVLLEAVAQPKLERVARGAQLEAWRAFVADLNNPG